MENILIETPSVKSEIVCGTGAFEKFAIDHGENISFVVTDSNVFALYGDLINKSFKGAKVHVIAAGEKSKNSGVLLAILKDMVACGLTRSSTVAAFGGGVVGDICGLAASLYMRGVKLVQIPTTLLSQVDSSVGGKTAVDMCGVKNVVGSFYQPHTVVVDPVFLHTLPQREIRCGLGEIIKYGALNADIYSKLTANSDNLNNFDFLEEIIVPCIRHKAAVVISDEKDMGGERKSLNLGHTTGHAFELNYKRKSHGEFVLIGMYYELFIAVKNGACDLPYAKELCTLIKKVIGKIPAYDCASSAAQTARYDKKNKVQSAVSMVVPKAVGQWQEITLPLATYSGQIGECAEAIKCNKW